MTLVVEEEVVVPLAVASAAIMTTVGVAVIDMGTGIVTLTVMTGTKDVTRGVRTEVRVQYINAVGWHYFLTDINLNVSCKI